MPASIFQRGAANRQQYLFLPHGVFLDTIKWRDDVCLHMCVKVGPNVVPQIGNSETERQSSSYTIGNLCLCHLSTCNSLAAMKVFML